MFKKLVCLGAVLMMCMGLFFACADGKKIWFEVGNVYYRGNYTVNADDVYDLTKIVHSLEELETICNERYSRFNDENGVIILEHDDYLIELIQRYDETYFTDKALVLYCFGESYYSRPNQVKAVIKKDEKLTLDLKRYRSSKVGAAISYTTYVIEVKKTDVINVNEINATTR